MKYVINNKFYKYITQKLLNVHGKCVFLSSKYITYMPLLPLSSYDLSYIIIDNNALYKGFYDIGPAVPLIGVLNDVFIQCALKYYFKYEHSTLPNYFSNMFQPSTHTYNTRHTGGFYQCKPNTLSGIKCIKYFLPSLLRDTPLIIPEKVHTLLLKVYLTISNISSFANILHIVM